MLGLWIFLSVLALCGFITFWLCKAFDKIKKLIKDSDEDI